MKTWVPVAGLGLIALLLVGMTFRGPGPDQPAAGRVPGTGPARQSDSRFQPVEVAFAPGSVAVSASGSGSVDGQGFEDEDVLISGGANGGWIHYFDGSDVGLPTSARIDGFHLAEDGRLLFSLAEPARLPSLGPIDGSDVIEFAPAAIGPDTGGGLTIHFDGSRHGLEAANVDAVALAPDGALLISIAEDQTVDSATVTGRDVLRFDGSGFDGSTLSLYLAGSQVDLAAPTENIAGLSVDPRGIIHLTTEGDHQVPGAIGSAADVLQCVPATPAPVTQCDWSSHWYGSTAGFPAGRVTGLTTIGSVNYFNDFTRPLGPEWIIYDSIGHAGWGLRRPSAIGTIPDPGATGGGSLTITADMGKGTEAGQLVSGGVKLLVPQTYGRYTVRLRADPDPDEATSMVALLWPQSDAWPRDGEIDIVETWASRADRNPVESNLHWLSPNAVEPFVRTDDRRSGAVHSGVSGTEWHTYILEWRADLVSVAVDGAAPRILSTDPEEIADWNMEPTLQLDAFDPPYAPGTQPQVSAPVTMYVDYLLVQP